MKALQNAKNRLKSNVWSCKYNGGKLDCPLVTGDLDTVVQTETNGRGSSLDGVVMVLAGVHHQLALDGSHPVLLVLGEELVPGHHQGVHVGDAAPRG